jgi:hypothetical protein
MADPLPPMPPSARKTRWSPLKILAVGCGGILLVGTLFVLGIFAVVRHSLCSSDAYKSALGVVQASPEVREALGVPIVPGWWVQGRINIVGTTGSAHLSFSVSGPKGRAEVFAEAYRRTGEWRLVTLIVKPEGRARPLDLLPGSDDSR